MSYSIMRWVSDPSELPARNRSEPLKEVAIFGAGIAGLSAAHELIERGYAVEVYERDAADPTQHRLEGETCAIGGQARTQWMSISLGPDSVWPLSTEGSPPTPREPVHFASRSADVSKNAAASLTAAAKILKQSDVEVEIRGFTSERELGPAEAFALDRAVKVGKAGSDSHGLAQRVDWQRALAVAQALQRYGIDGKRLYVRAMGLGRGSEWAVPDSQRDCVTFHMRQDLLPGEHGFRFFPAFYRHVHDTMKRTPIADERDRRAFFETRRSVRDNIMAAAFQRVAAREDDDPTSAERSFTFSRRPAKAPQDLLDTISSTLQTLRVSPKDFTHHQLKLFKYITSCSERRAKEYEHLSWYDFMEADNFAAEFRDYFDRMGRVNIAAPAKHNDARTYGNITVQLYMSQVDPEFGTDGTLNGPTSVAWFNHWRRYLETQGVEFHHGRLEGFEFCEGKPRPLVTLSPDTEAAEKLLLERDYYIVATNLLSAQQLFADEERFPANDFIYLRGMDTSDVQTPDPQGCLRHLLGIQYFLPSDGSFVNGHATYIDAPWGLTSIAQPQFWSRRRGWWDGYRSVLSVDVASWDVVSPRLGKTAWQCSRQEIAEEVWRQISETFKDRTLLPPYRVYHIDAWLEFAARGKAGVVRNDAPYLVTLPGQFPSRPGRLDDTGYTVHFGNLVLAGTHMHTHTRLTSMEAANESGRHAVNGILHADAFRGARCRIWDPEQEEMKDLQPLIDLDRRLVSLDLPHFADILELREVPSALLCSDTDIGTKLQTLSTDVLAEMSAQPDKGGR